MAPLDLTVIVPNPPQAQSGAASDFADRDRIPPSPRVVCAGRGRGRGGIASGPAGELPSIRSIRPIDSVDPIDLVDATETVDSVDAINRSTRRNRPMP
jgi:hypothetical protein